MIDKIDGPKYRYKLMTIRAYSNFSTACVTVSGISSLQIPSFLFIVGLIDLTRRLRLAGWSDPTLFFAMVVMFSTVMIVIIFFGLTFSSFVWIPSILSQLFNSPELFLVSFDLLLFLQFFLFLHLLMLLSNLFFISLLLMCWRGHIVGIMMTDVENIVVFC